MTATVSVHHLGREGEPVAVIDNFAPDPMALRAAAAATPFEPAGQHYPGIRAPLPSSYLTSIRPLLSELFRDLFGVRERVSVIDMGFAIVTAAPQALTVEQRLPHVDAIDEGRLALIHYLGEGADTLDRDGAGTGFYRHRSTGFETIDADRSAAYFAALNADLAREGQPPAAYLNDGNAMFDRIGGFAGRFNRALVYRGRLLHSGDIDAQTPLSSDPARGRLTTTGFFATT